MFFDRFAKREKPFPLVVGMTGVKLGDRVAQIGCPHGGRLAAIAATVGLSGRAVAVVADEAAAARATKGGEQQGVFIEIETAPPTALPFEDASFDLVIIDDTANDFAALRPEARVACVREVARVVRPGGRVMFFGAAPRQGLGALVTRSTGGPSYVSTPAAREILESDGFRGIRTLAEREGLIFVEGIKPR